MWITSWPVKENHLFYSERGCFLTKPVDCWSKGSAVFVLIVCEDVGHSCAALSTHYKQERNEFGGKCYHFLHSWKNKDWKSLPEGKVCVIFLVMTEAVLIAWKSSLSALGACVFRLQNVLINNNNFLLFSLGLNLFWIGPLLFSREK